MALRLCGSTPTVGSSSTSSCGLVQQPGGDVGPPLHAARVALDPVVGPVGETHDREDVVDPAAERLAGQAVEAAEELQVLAGGQVVVEGELLGHQPDGGLGADRARRHRQAGDDHLASVALEQAAQHRDGGRLARAVRAEQPVGLAPGDLEADPVDRLARRRSTCAGRGSGRLGRRARARTVLPVLASGTRGCARRGPRARARVGGATGAAIASPLAAALGLVVAERRGRRGGRPAVRQHGDGRVRGARRSTPNRRRRSGRSRCRSSPRWPPGPTPTVAVDAGQAIRIMTGAPIPPGADAIVMVERTSPRRTGGIVNVEVPAQAGRPHPPGAGDDIRPGDEVVDRRRRPHRRAHLGVLASVGVTDVIAHPRPRVGVLSTGDELVEGGRARCRPGQIRESNRHALLGLVAASGLHRRRPRARSRRPGGHPRRHRPRRRARATPCCRAAA